MRSMMQNDVRTCSFGVHFSRFGGQTSLPAAAGCLIYFFSDREAA
jgi:hypothetical protein